ISSDSSDGIAAITSKLDSLGRDMKKLKENVHAIQVGCEIYEGAHIDKDCPLNEEVKKVKEIKYEEAGRTFPINGGNRYPTKENIKKNLKHHDDTIQTLDDKIRTLTKEMQTQVTRAEVTHCKAIFTKEGLPLFIPFEYSSKELKYFSSKSLDSDKEAQHAEEE
ncbi:hypothetical protein Tco_0695623, partial [Tanacetum coccineum]